MSPGRMSTLAVATARMGGRSALADELRRELDAGLDDFGERIRDIVRQELARAAGAGDPDELWTAERAARARGMSPAAFRRAHERGTLGIEAIKVGKRALRWRAGDVRALAQATGVR